MRAERDLETLLALLNDPHISEFISEGQTNSAAEALELIGKRELYLLFHKGDVVGFAGFAKPKVLHADWDVVYAVLKNSCGRGLGTEACRALVNYAVANQRLPLVAVVDGRNVASIRVLGKCGFVPREAPAGDLDHLRAFVRRA